MRIYTIGYTQKTARHFFGLLRTAQAAVVLDIRLRNNSSIAGFARRQHLEFFVAELTSMRYQELPLLAPSEEMFLRLQRDRDWAVYEVSYGQLMEARRVEHVLERGLFRDGAVLLCGEPTPERCHRRLAAEFLAARVFPGAEIAHL